MNRRGFTGAVSREGLRERAESHGRVELVRQNRQADNFLCLRRGDLHQHLWLKLWVKHVSYVRESRRCCFIYFWDAYLVWMWWEEDGAPHNKEAVWGESSGVKCSPEFMSSMVMSISNPSAGKEGTGRLLGLVSQQVQLGQWAPDSSGRHFLKTKKQPGTWKLIPEVDLWPLSTPPYKCINTCSCYDPHVYTDPSTCTWPAHRHTSKPPDICTSACTHILIHMNSHSLLKLPKQKQVEKES